MTNSKLEQKKKIKQKVTIKRNKGSTLRTVLFNKYKLLVVILNFVMHCCKNNDQEFICFFLIKKYFNDIEYNIFIYIFLTIIPKIVINKKKYYIIIHQFGHLHWRTNWNDFCSVSYQVESQVLFRIRSLPNTINGASNKCLPPWPHLQSITLCFGSLYLLLWNTVWS